MAKIRGSTILIRLRKNLKAIFPRKHSVIADWGRWSPASRSTTTLTECLPVMVRPRSLLERWSFVAFQRVHEDFLRGWAHLLLKQVIHRRFSNRQKRFCFLTFKGGVVNGRRSKDGSATWKILFSMADEPPENPASCFLTFTNRNFQVHHPNYRIERLTYFYR